MSTLKFDDLKRIEPGLGRLARNIAQIGRKPRKDFCANGLWLFYFKPEVCKLVGYGAKDKRLQTCEAYDAAYHYLYNLLPDCRHEGRMCL
jgi:hypothetical protein